ELDRAPLPPPAEHEPAGRRLEHLHVVELVAAVGGERIEDLALRERTGRPLDRPAAPEVVETGVARLVRIRVPPGELVFERGPGNGPGAGIGERLGGDGVHANSSTVSRSKSAARSESGRLVPPLARARAAAHPRSGSATSAITQPIRLRRSALPSASSSVTGSAPRRTGTVGSPSLTTTRSGTAFGWRSNSPRNNRRARR